MLKVNHLTRNQEDTNQIGYDRLTRTNNRMPKIMLNRPNGRILLERPFEETIRLGRNRSVKA